MKKAELVEVELIKSIIRLADELDDLKTLEYMTTKLSLFVLYYTDTEKHPMSFIDLAEYVELLRKNREKNVAENDPSAKYVAKLRKEFEDM